jgi:hypothetical protein
LPDPIAAGALQRRGFPLRSLVGRFLAIIVGVTCAGTAYAQREPQGPRPVAPAKKANPSKPEPMKVVLVRGTAPGCEPNCPEWIAAQGMIDDAAVGQFRRVLARIGARKLPVLVDSVGGTVDASLAIGRMLRGKGLEVAVTRTVIEPCAAPRTDCRDLKAAGIDLGRPEARISKCASACAFLLAGGARRYVGEWALVGVHEMKTITTRRLIRQHFTVEPRAAIDGSMSVRRRLIREDVLSVETREGPASEKAYDKIRRYFAEMGIGDAIMPIMRDAPNSSIRWVKMAELQATRLATDFVNGEQLLFAKPPAAAVAAVAPTAASPDTTAASKPACDATAPAASPCATAAAPIPAAAPKPAAAGTGGVAPARVAAPAAPVKAVAKPGARPKPRAAAAPKREPAAQPFSIFAN